MNYDRLLEKRDFYQQNKGLISEITLESYEHAFEIEYTHNSTAIEGNTLTLIETKVVLEEGIAIGGKNLCEIYEQVNHQKAFRYVKDCIAENMPLNENIVKEIHAILMNNNMIDGVYRNVDVYISGAQHTPPTPNIMYQQIKVFYADFEWKSRVLNPIELAAWTHAEFVRIHPFADGNGRTSRLIMNYQLMSNGYLPISIAKEDRLAYFNALERYAVNGELDEFAGMIGDLEDRQLERYVGMIERYENVNE